MEDDTRPEAWERFEEELAEVPEDDRGYTEEEKEEGQ